MRLLHGSERQGLLELDPSTADGICAFGPGIYLTDDEMVAKCYSRGGSIYIVELAGDLADTISMNQGFASQSDRAKAAILSTASRFGFGAPTASINARSAIHPYGADQKAVNLHLASRGIWMLYGELESMEKSGLMDRGVQYVVIAKGRTRVVAEHRHDA